ncbi:MAG: LptF/LptG family permease [Deltaproteobacteria bacterium]|nr:LptF/LptG family permease [Deltaproteobacteria bacterium]
MPLFLPLIPVMVTALALSFLSIPFLRYLGFKIKHLDHPAARKIHQTPVPLMGGVAILGASLGLQTKRSGRSWGVTLALAIFLIYYVFLSAAWSLGQSGAYPVSLGMWMPNVIFLTLGLYLLKRTAEEKPIALLELIIRLGSSVKDYVRKRFALA